MGTPWRQRVNDMTTNKASANPDASDDLRAEYHLDYAQSRPNRFASRISGRLSYSGMQRRQDRRAPDVQRCLRERPARAGEGDEGER